MTHTLNTDKTAAVSPDMNMPTLKDCYKHHALPSEYRRHMERIKRNLT